MELDTLVQPQQQERKRLRSTTDTEGPAPPQTSAPTEEEPRIADATLTGRSLHKKRRSRAPVSPPGLAAAGAAIFPQDAQPPARMQHVLRRVQGPVLAPFSPSLSVSATTALALLHAATGSRTRHVTLSLSESPPADTATGAERVSLRAGTTVAPPELAFVRPSRDGAQRGGAPPLSTVSSEPLRKSHLPTRPPLSTVSSGSASVIKVKSPLLDASAASALALTLAAPRVPVLPNAAAPPRSGRARLHPSPATTPLARGRGGRDTLLARVGLSGVLRAQAQLGHAYSGDDPLAGLPSPPATESFKRSRANHRPPLDLPPYLPAAARGGPSSAAEPASATSGGPEGDSDADRESGPDSSWRPDQQRKRHREGAKNGAKPARSKGSAKPVLGKRSAKPARGIKGRVRRAIGLLAPGISVHVPRSSAASEVAGAPLSSADAAKLLRPLQRSLAALTVPFSSTPVKFGTEAKGREYLDFMLVLETGERLADAATERAKVKVKGGARRAASDGKTCSELGCEGAPPGFLVGDATASCSNCRDAESSKYADGYFVIKRNDDKATASHMSLREFGQLCGGDSALLAKIALVLGVEHYPVASDPTMNRECTDIAVTVKRLTSKLIAAIADVEGDVYVIVADPTLKVRPRGAGVWV